MKTKVKITSDDFRYQEYKAGEFGYVDGYCRGGDDTPYAVVAVNDRIVLVSINCLKVITQ